MADNLEDLNRQLEEAQNKATKAEKEYSSVRDQLSKMGDEYYKTTLLTVEEQKNVIQKYKTLRETLNKEIERRNVLNKALDEETKVEKQKVEKTKQEVTEIQKKIEEAKKPSTWKKLLGTAQSENSFEQMYRVRQRFGGIEQILAGNIGSGLSQFAGSFKAISTIMGGPLFLAIQTVTSGLLRLDKAIAETRNEVMSATGGALSPFRGNYVGSLTFRNQLQSGLLTYGQQDQWKELASTALQSTGMGSIINPNTGKIDENLLAERTLNQGSTLKYMTSMGISADTVNKLFKISRNIEKMDEIGSQSLQYRLAKMFSTSRSMTTQEGAEQSISLYEQTKSLGVNFEWAARTVRKFDDALQKGEVTLNDFAAISRGVKGADTGRAAGLAAMLKDYAMRSGIELPREFMQASDVGAGFYLTTREGIANKSIQRALVGMAKEQGAGINFGSTQLDQAAALQYYLGKGPYGANISSDMIQKIVKTGDWTDIVGGRGGAARPEQTEQALEVDKEAAKLHDEELSIAGQIKEAVGQIVRDLQTGIVVDVSQKSWTDLMLTTNLAFGPGFQMYGVRNVAQKGSDINTYSSPLTAPSSK